jgi:hypothetical protein
MTSRTTDQTAFPTKTLPRAVAVEGGANPPTKDE